MWTLRELQLRALLGLLAALQIPRESWHLILQASNGQFEQNEAQLGPLLTCLRRHGYNVEHT